MISAQTRFAFFAAHFSGLCFTPPCPASIRRSRPSKSRTPPALRRSARRIPVMHNRCLLFISSVHALTFRYTVGAGDNTASLAATGVTLNAATAQNSLGNGAILFNGVTQAGPQIDAITPTVTSVVASGAGRHCDLCGRLRQQCADVHLYRGARPEHRGAGGDGVQCEEGDDNEWCRYRSRSQRSGNQPSERTSSKRPI